MHRTTAIRRISTCMLLAACIIPATSLTARADEKSGPTITHVPIPLAAKGKPLPILAKVTDTKGKVSSVSLSVKASKTAKTSTIDMKADGEGNYKASIPSKSTSGTALLYQIQAVSDGGTSETAWLPVKTESIEDKIKEKAEDETKKKSHLAKAKDFIVAHPYISAGAAVGTIAVVAVAGGGGGDGGGGDPSAYAGDIRGSWSGSGYSGHFHVNIAPCGEITGSYSGSESGPLSGRVSGDGSFSASGSAGASSWSGRVSGSSGNLSASGTWSGFGAGGSWSGSGG